MEALKPSEILAKAADLIEPEGAWLQGRYSNGENHSPHDADATCWCVNGALYRCGSADWEAVEAARAVLRSLVDKPTSSWNDDSARIQAEVVAALRKASELAKAEGQ